MVWQSLGFWPREFEEEGGRKRTWYEKAAGSQYQCELMALLKTHTEHSVSN